MKHAPGFFLALLCAVQLAVCVIGFASCANHATADDSPAGAVVKRRAMKDGADPKAPSAREKAREDFSASVKTWGRVLTGLLVLVGVAALVLSFLPLGHVLGLETREAVLVLALSAATPILQYALQAWGVLAADLAVWLLLAGLVISVGTLGAMLFRRRAAIVKRITAAGDQAISGRRRAPR